MDLLGVIMECSFCNKVICSHAYMSYSSKGSLCLECKEINPTILCIPTYEGKLDLSSQTYSTVCKECYNNLIREVE